MLRGDRRAPGGLELRAGNVVEGVLEAGQLVGDRAHVSPALDVVLAAQRLEARAPLADLARHEREVDQREDVVDGVVVLRDPERPAELHVLGSAVGVGEVADRLRGDAGDALGLLERPRLDRVAVGLEAGRRPLDELHVGQAGGDDLAPDGVRQRDVGADVEPEPEVGPLRRRRAPRIDDDQLRAAVHGLEHVVEEDRVRVARVRAPEHDQVRGSESPRRSSSRRLHRTPSPDRRR